MTVVFESDAYDDLSSKGFSALYRIVDGKDLKPLMQYNISGPKHSCAKRIVYRNTNKERTDRLPLTLTHSIKFNNNFNFGSKIRRLNSL